MCLDGCAPASGLRVALLDIDGLLLNTDFTGPYSLGENPLALFQERLQAIEQDANVGAVVLRINSPGGSVTACDIMLHELKQFRARKPVPMVACLLDVGAGGAYYVATAADGIVAAPTSVTGGIGVILNLYNLRDTMQMMNIIPQEVKSGEMIDMGSPVRKLPDDVKKLLDQMAKEYHLRFRTQVECARPKIDRQQAEIFDGRVFTATQALQYGLIDHIGYLDEAIALARRDGCGGGGSVCVYHRKNDPARSRYSTSPNVPLQATAWPASLPGAERPKLPTFLYLWQPEATMERLGGK